MSSLFTTRFESKLEVITSGFNSLNLNPDYVQSALRNLREWLTNKEFEDYHEQLYYLTDRKDWDYLLDCFYKVIPFGTGGRRGEVGIGPNRINEWTIRSSAQGHAQYLLNKYGDEAKSRGIVFTYDVRVFHGNNHLSSQIPCSIYGLDGKRLSRSAAEVYAGNGIKVYMFHDIRTTPELSFTIRHLKAIAGDMFSASHNPPDHNGKKVYDDSGGQLIPPHDENLVHEVTQNVKAVNSIPFDSALKSGLIEYLNNDVDDAYFNAVCALTLSKNRNVNIVYTPLHGCGRLSLEKILINSGFKVDVEPLTSNPSGKFENVTFNIPNPEVVESFEIPLRYARQKQADILLNSDPDADRLGIMVRHNDDWYVLNGNEIGIVLTEYALRKAKERNITHPVVVKTLVTTNLIEKICIDNNAKVFGDLLVGFKYVGDLMNTLEKDSRIEDFIIASEESNGYLAGNYSRDKDAAIAGLWLCELAAELKAESKTLIDHLNQLYLDYGYYRNYLTEIRLLGATGLEKIKKIQNSLRNDKPKRFDNYIVNDCQDLQDRKPITSNTDFESKNMLIFNLAPFEKITSAKVTVRPSGTEPKLKLYFELSTYPNDHTSLEAAKEYVELELKNLEKSVMNYCYKLIDVDFPDRGYLLFWQLPLTDKLHYFEIEEKIAELKDETIEKKTKLNELLAFLGSDPLEKVNHAFKEKYGKTIETYIEL